MATPSIQKMLAFSLGYAKAKQAGDINYYIGRVHEVLMLAVSTDKLRSYRCDKNLVHARHQTGRPRHIIFVVRKDLR